MGIFNKILNENVPSDTLFLSREFRDFMEFATNSELRRAKKKTVKVYIVDEGPNETAFTSMEKMVINYGFRLIAALPSKQKQFAFIKGFNGHELGHLLYDDFYQLIRMTKVWNETHALYPLSNHLNILDDNLQSNYQDIKEYLKDENKSDMMYRYYKKLNNILSDAYVNYQVLQKSVRYGDALRYTLEQFRKSLMAENYYEFMSRENITLSSKLLTLIHRCSVFGIIYDDAENELNKLAVELIPVYDKIKRTEYGEARETYYQKIFCIIWPVLKADIDEISKSTEKSSQLIDSLLCGAPDNMEGLSEKPMRTAPQIYNETMQSDVEQVETGEYDVIIQKLQARADEKNKNGDSVQAQSEGEKPANMTDTKEESNQETGRGTSTGDNNAQPEISYDYRIYDKEVQNLGDNVFTEERFELKENESREFQRIIDSISAHGDEKKKEKEYEGKLIEFNQALSYPTIHTGLKVCIARPYEFNNAQSELENVVRKRLHSVAQRMADEISKIPLKRRKGGKISGYYYGKHINMPAITRQDKKIFERITLPTDRPKLAIQLLIDESGSTRGKRIECEKTACLLFHDMAEQMKIPVGIIGHKGDTNTPQGHECDVRLNIYSDFTASRYDYKRILEMEAGGDNRDGYAIVYAAERLLLQKADERICIIFSDGKPNANKNSYRGALAVQDIRYILQKYKKQNIKFIAAAIGDDKQTIKQIYGDDFVDIKSPEKIPQFLADVLKSVYR